MKPIVKLATARTPDGGEMVLYHHDRDFSIRVNGSELMQSRQHESELELARLGCAHLVDRKEPCILIGGLGMGYTVRQALDMVGPRARVVVAELLNAVVDWNRRFLGELNGRPIEDGRVDLRTTDVVPLIARSSNKFDAILLDIDNGPDAMTDSGNSSLYDQEGIESCREALRGRGCLAIWSTAQSRKFEKLLKRCGFHVRLFRAPAHRGSRVQSRCVWVASEDGKLLPAPNTA
jgi:spermidine synthase